MSCDTRTFNIKMLREAYENYGESGVTNCIGKTEIFIYKDDESHIVIKNWVKHREKSIKILKNVS